MVTKKAGAAKNGGATTARTREKGTKLIEIPPALLRKVLDSTARYIGLRAEFETLVGGLDPTKAVHFVLERGVGALVADHSRRISRLAQNVTTKKSASKKGSKKGSSKKATNGRRKHAEGGEGVPE